MLRNTHTTVPRTVHVGGGRWLIVLAASILMLASAAAADAASGIAAFTTGASTTQAGGHPDVRADLQVNTLPNGAPDGQVGTVTLRLPAGLTGDPNAVPQCDQESIAAANDGQGNNVLIGDRILANCPANTQVGTAKIWVSSSDVSYEAAIINAETLGDDAGRLVIAAFGLPVIYVGITGRTTTDYGLDSATLEVDGQLALRRIALQLWGVPGAHERGGRFCLGTFCQVYNQPVPPEPPAMRRPFMTNPTVCDAPKITRAVVTFDGETGEHEASSSDPTPTNCEGVPFDPSIDVQPTSTKADDATGLDVKLTVPQNDDADGIATGHLRKAEVTLPEGTTLNPGAANGLEACTDIQFNFGSDLDAQCPEASKVGTVTFNVPILPGPLSGAVYLGQQLSDDPQSGKMFRLFQYVKGYGLTIKIPGYVKADPQTGRLTATFGDLKTLYGAVPDGMLDGLPQVPFSDFTLKFKGGSRGVLATPPTGGIKTTVATFTSWSGKVVTTTSAFSVAPRPGLGWFGPYFSAGTVSPVAGASSPFALRIRKPDGQSNLNGLSLSLPEGLLANLKGNVGTRVGTAHVAAGPGSSPFWLDGPVVLEGPYGDAPFSLRVTVPAIAGPFNLGDVVVRQKIYVDPHDAHVTVVSDPLPTIVKGVPVRLQSLNVDVDKPGFMINPTSCAVKSIGGTLAASTGQTAAVASRFQVGGCKNLPLDPKLSLDLIGKKEIKKGKHPKLSTTVTQQPGESGLKKVAVRLPLSLALDPDNAQALCKPEQAAAKACPAGSIIGKATAVSPVLNRPLTGNVFFVEGTRQTAEGRTAKTMPKLWVALRGEVALDVWADSSLEDSKYLVTTFGFIPDAPISSFKLDIDGGKHGILAVTGKTDANLCQKPLVAKVQFDGQNGKRVKAHPVMGSPCRFRVQDKTLHSTRTKVRVSGIGAGKLTLSGKGVKKTRRTIKRADVASITAKLTSTGKRAYKGRKAIRLKVSFNPKAKGEKTHSLRTTVKRAKARKKSSSRSGSTSRTR